MSFASLIVNNLFMTVVVVIHNEILRLLYTPIAKLKIKNQLQVVFSTIYAPTLKYVFRLRFFPSC